MRSSFLLPGCALSVIILLTANLAQAKPVSPSAHLAPHNASVNVDGQTDAPDKTTPIYSVAGVREQAEAAMYWNAPHNL